MVLSSETSYPEDALVPPGLVNAPARLEAPHIVSVNSSCCGRSSSWYLQTFHCTGILNIHEIHVHHCLSISNQADRRGWQITPGSSA